MQRMLYSCIIAYNSVGVIIIQAAYILQTWMYDQGAANWTGLKCQASRMERIGREGKTRLNTGVAFGVARPEGFRRCLTG